MSKLNSIFIVMLILVGSVQAKAVDDSYAGRLVDGPKLSAEDAARVQRLEAVIKNSLELQKSIQAEQDQIEKMIHFIARIAKQDKIEISVKPTLKSHYLYLANQQEYSTVKHEIDLMNPAEIQERVETLQSMVANLNEELQMLEVDIRNQRNDLKNIYNKYLSQIDLNSL